MPQTETLPKPSETRKRGSAKGQSGRTAVPPPAATTTAAEGAGAAPGALAERARAVRDLKHLAKAMRLRVDQIRIDPTIQSRAELDEATVEEYAELYAAGADLPPLVVVKAGGRYLLGDGFHRYAALPRAGRTEVDVLVLEGSEDDARLYSAGANTDHGLRRTQADKQKAVRLASENPLCAGWSNQRLAAWCGVSDKFAAKWRRDRRPGDPDATVTYVTGDGRTIERKARTARTARSNKAAVATHAAAEPDPETDIATADTGGGQSSPAMIDAPVSAGAAPQVANSPGAGARPPESVAGIGRVRIDGQPHGGGGPTATAAAAAAEQLDILARGLGMMNFDALAGVVRSDERARADARVLVPLLRRMATALENALADGGGQ